MGTEFTLEVRYLDRLSHRYDNLLTASQEKKTVISAIPLIRLYSTVFSISEERLPGGGVK